MYTYVFFLSDDTFEDWWNKIFFADTKMENKKLNKLIF